ncbi:hypothetical protein PIB30_019361 [Stylosanthes scabra]|uniref:RRM domain-containing protein n=1 Tax=Stylosanthes scabra TaxID=79078 RepID=A0ABU6X736_9FABA|nr:hypothetical protein [Stylosanthes scabra]
MFVDGLPRDIAKRSLFKIFGWVGGVIDIYVSRKVRKGSKCPFAFVGFDSRGGAERAVQKLNGTFMGTNRMEIKIAEFKRRWRSDDEGPQVRHARMGREGGFDRAKNRCRAQGGAKEYRHATKQVTETRKTIEVHSDPIQLDILRRSVVGESIESIRFKWIKEQIAEKWEGPGEVYYRDMGPFKCILTFESVEARDRALVSPGLCPLFDELRPQWGFSMVRSRRVWIEVVGVPIHLWSVETFMNIGKIWGKPVMMDELTELYILYTCGSILIDSYQWDMINEWVVLVDGERRFEVYVKEFGREMYSALAHQGEEDEGSLCRVNESRNVNDEASFGMNQGPVVEVSEEADVSVKTVEAETASPRVDDDKVGHIWDPLIDDVIERREHEWSGCMQNNVNGGCHLDSVELVGSGVNSGRGKDYCGPTTLLPGEDLGVVVMLGLMRSEAQHQYHWPDVAFDMGCNGNMGPIFNRPLELELRDQDRGNGLMTISQLDENASGPVVDTMDLGHELIEDSVVGDTTPGPHKNEGAMDSPPVGPVVPSLSLDLGNWVDTMDQETGINADGGFDVEIRSVELEGDRVNDPLFLSPVREAMRVVDVCEDGGICFKGSEKKLIERNLVKAMGRSRLNPYGLRPRRQGKGGDNVGGPDGNVDGNVRTKGGKDVSL